MESSTAAVRVGLVQMTCGDEPGANLDKAVRRIEMAARRGAQIVCLQELFCSVYFCQREDTSCFRLAEPIPGPTTETLSRVARDRQVVLIAPVFEKRAAGLFHNAVAVIDADGTLLGTYRKMHIRTTRCTMKSSISPQAIWVFRRLRPATPGSAS